MWLSSWVIVVLVLAGIVILLIKASDSIYVLQLIKDRFFYIFLVLIFAFLAISLTRLHTTYDINLTSTDGIGKALKIYWSWLVNVGKNIGRVTGYVAKQDWFSANVTNATLK